MVFLKVCIGEINIGRGNKTYGITGEIGIVVFGKGNVNIINVNYFKFDNMPRKSRQWGSYSYLLIDILG